MPREIMRFKKFTRKTITRKLFALIAIGFFVFLIAVGAIVGQAVGQAAPSLEKDSNPFLPSLQTNSMVFAPVKLDGHVLFLVGAEASNGQGMLPGSMSPVETRAQAIEKTFYKVIARGFDPEMLKVSPKVEGKTADILLSDGKEYKDFSLLVYSEMDARISGYTLSEASGYVSYVIYKALLRSQMERQAGNLWEQGLTAGKIALGAIFASLILNFLQRRLMVGWRSLRNLQRAEAQRLNAIASEVESVDEDSDASSYTNVMMTQQMDYDRGLNRYDLYRHLLQLGHVLIWLAGIAWIVGLFPYTRGLQVFVLQQPMLLGVFLGMNLAIKYSGVLLDRLLAQWATRESLTPEATQRWTLRISSFSPILKVIIAIILIGLALFYVLYILNIPLAPVIAGAGILGFAISLGSQTLVKDLISGALILIEDQYAIGDFVFLNDNFGRVERMNLRITSLRNREGTVIITPNSDIRVVKNLSKDWSRTKLFIYIDYDTDIDLANSVLQQVIDELNVDEFWGPQIIEAEIRGVEEIDAGGFTIGVRFETKPGVYRKVIREYRKRMKPAFDRAGIKLATQVTTILSRSSVEDDKASQKLN
jgi:moderate conductance mechanosensitive channel